MVAASLANSLIAVGPLIPARAGIAHVAAPASVAAARAVVTALAVPSAHVLTRLGAADQGANRGQLLCARGGGMHARPGSVAEEQPCRQLDDARNAPRSAFRTTPHCRKPRGKQRALACRE